MRWIISNYSGTVHECFYRMQFCGEERIGCWAGRLVVLAVGAGDSQLRTTTAKNPIGLLQYFLMAIARGTFTNIFTRATVIMTSRTPANYFSG
jgi:hypothetical protein